MSRRLGIMLGIAAALIASVAPHSAIADGLPLPVDGSNKASVGSLDGTYRYSAISNGNETTVLRIDADGGSIDRSRRIPGDFSLPLVAYNGTASGLSADGSTLVLIEPRRAFPRETTEFKVLDADTLKQLHAVHLDGDFSFDAISPDGRFLYLINYKSATDPTDYEVRSYDVRRGALTKNPIIDPDEPDEKMTGLPQARVMSPDGRWAYTLYGGGEETFIHALDTAGGTAVCVDLPEFNPQQSFRLGLSVDPSSGVITVIERGEPAATVDPGGFEVNAVVPAGADEPSSTGSGAGVDWIGVAAVAGGALLLAAAGLAAVRWRRRATA